MVTKAATQTTKKWTEEVKAAGQRKKKATQYRPDRDSEMLIRAVCLDGQTRKEVLDVHVPAGIDEHRNMMFARNSLADGIPWGNLDPRGRALIEAQILVAYMLPDMPDWLEAVLADDIEMLFAVSAELMRHQTLFFRRDGLEGEAEPGTDGAPRICALDPIDSDGQRLEPAVAFATGPAGDNVGGAAVHANASQNASGPSGPSGAVQPAPAGFIPAGAMNPSLDEAQIDAAVQRPKVQRRSAAKRR